MMEVHGCLILCFMLIYPHGFITYQTKSGVTASNVLYEGLDPENNSHDKIEPTRVASRVANVDYDDSKMHFGYEDYGRVKSVYGPQNWGKISSNCDGTHQSPVNLDLQNSKRLFSPPLVIEGFDTVPSTILMNNNGHSALVKMLFKDNSHVTVSGGPLHGHYVMDNIHWHWGKCDTAGSEHAFDGTRFAAEMHIVLHNSNFSSANEANQGGLAVLAFIYDLNNKLSATYNPFVPLLSKVIEHDTTYSESQQLFTIRDLIRSANFHYATYEGSLTSPMCYEKVTWIVSTKKLFISSWELQEFRNIKDGDGYQLVENDRPLQKLNGRSVYIH